MLLDADSYRRFLSEELVRRLTVNPRYSQRAFARQLGLSAGELSEILRGKRDLSLKSALKIARALGLSPAETKHLVDLTHMERGRRIDPRALADGAGPASTKQLTLDMFHIVSDWYCFAILNLAETPEFTPTPDWVARRLGITKVEARVALERLERVGLVTRKKGGGFDVTEDFVISPAGIPSEAIRNYHRQILEKAITALDNQPMTERDVSGVGFAVDPKALPSIKKEISDFQDRLVAKYSKGRKTEVYQFETALFRLTEKETPHERK